MSIIPAPLLASGRVTIPSNSLPSEVFIFTVSTDMLKTPYTDWFYVTMDASTMHMLGLGRSQQGYVKLSGQGSGLDIRRSDFFILAFMIAKRTRHLGFTL